jgi:hypothetical protein
MALMAEATKQGDDICSTLMDQRILVFFCDHEPCILEAIAGLITYMGETNGQHAI